MIMNPTFFKLPYPFLVLDDFLSQTSYNTLRDCLNSSDGLTISAQFTNSVERKDLYSHQSPSSTRDSEIYSLILDQLVSEDMLSLISKSLQIDAPIIPLLSINGSSGLSYFHTMHANSVLGPHVDHSYLLHGSTLYRKVANAIFYIPEVDNWPSSYGGHTRFHSCPNYTRKRSIDYKKNRLVIFKHNSKSIHSVYPLSADCSFSRHSVYMDYYILHPGKSSPNDFDHGTTFFPLLSNTRDFLSHPRYLKALLLYIYKYFLSKI